MKRFLVKFIAWIVCAVIIAVGVYLTVKNSDFEALKSDFASLDNYSWITPASEGDSAN